jgi:hypothetical protein
MIFQLNKEMEIKNNDPFFKAKDMLKCKLCEYMILALIDSLFHVTLQSDDAFLLRVDLQGVLQKSIYKLFLYQKVGASTNQCDGLTIHSGYLSRYSP